MARPKAGYRLADGTSVPGVTTIIGRFKDSDALLQWAFQQGQLAERGVIRTLYERRDEAADAGTLAHEMVEAHILGQIPEDLLAGVRPDIVDKATNAYLAYLEWQAQSRVEIYATEVSLVSERHAYGGTIDAVFRMPDGRLELGDWKTSNGVYEDYLIQLAAYRGLWTECRPDEPLAGSHLLRFSKDSGDFAHHYYQDLSDAWHLFLLYRQAYDLSKAVKKRAA